MNRRRLVNEYELMLAHNFLGNISLDGSHNDTKLAIFNKPGLPKLVFKKHETLDNLQTNAQETEDDNDEDGLAKKQVSFFEHVAVNELSPDEQIPKTCDGLNLEAPLPSTSVSPLTIRSSAPEDSVSSSQTSTRKCILDRTVSLACKGRKGSRHESDARKMAKKEVEGSNESLNFLKKISQFFHSLDKSGFDKLADRTSKLDVSERERHLSGSSSIDTGALQPLDFSNSHVEISYRELLVPYGLLSPAPLTAMAERNHSRCSSTCIPPITEGETLPVQAFTDLDTLDVDGHYDPYILDDPNFRCTRNKNCVSLISYSLSVIDYVNSLSLKKETNERFRTEFPLVDLSYSKLLSIKKEMKEICSESGIDLLTLAHAYAYFEKIVLSALISKSNRKQIAGCCLLVAAKLNDFKGEELSKFLDTLEDSFRCSRKEMFSLELPVVIALEFSLYLPDWEIFPHYHKLVWNV